MSKIIHPIIRQIVDRCHVGDSYTDVARYAISRLKHGKRSYHAMDRANRRELLSQVFEQHARNRELYATVMSGFAR